MGGGVFVIYNARCGVKFKNNTVYIWHIVLVEQLDYQRNSSISFIAFY
jgi:hypothetical protein